MTVELWWLCLVLMMLQENSFFKSSHCRNMDTYDDSDDLLLPKPICNYPKCLKLKQKHEMKSQSTKSKGRTPHHQKKHSKKKDSQYGDRIVNGKNTKINKHPWIVFLNLKNEKGGRSLCSGSILDSRHIVTAKHCIVETTGDGYLMYGEENKNVNRSRIDFTRDNVIFNKVGYVDVVIIKSPKRIPVRNSGKVQAITLPRNKNQKPSLTDKAVVSGWGNSCDDPGKCRSQKRLVPYLQSVQIIIMKPTCFFKWDVMLFGKHQRDTLLCASGPKMDDMPQDSCAGDSGGPLECKDDKDKVYLCGVVSMGPDPGQCGTSPGGYTMTSIPCVLIFLQSRGTKFRGTGEESTSEKAEEGTCSDQFRSEMGRSFSPRLTQSNLHLAFLTPLFGPFYWRRLL